MLNLTLPSAYSICMPITTLSYVSRSLHCMIKDVVSVSHSQTNRFTKLLITYCSLYGSNNPKRTKFVKKANQRIHSYIIVRYGQLLLCPIQNLIYANFIVTHILNSSIRFALRYAIYQEGWCICFRWHAMMMFHCVTIFKYQVQFS